MAIFIVTAQGSEKRQSVLVGQHEIQGHDAIFLPGKRRSGFPRRIDDVHDKSTALEQGAEQKGRVLVVFADQLSWPVGLLTGGRPEQSVLDTELLRQIDEEDRAVADLRGEADGA